MGDDNHPKNIFVDDAAKAGESAPVEEPTQASEPAEEVQASANDDSGNAGSASGFKDKTLTCRDCNQEFVWTAGEQDFYKQKGFDNPPSRCRICRGKYKAAREQFGRVESKITCKKCGKESTVPFVPRDPNTVLCRECFQADKGQR